jgi:protein SCO1
MKLLLPMFVLVSLLFSPRCINAKETHAARGLVVKVDAAQNTVLVSCEEIPGYMSAMVMDFSVRDPKELSSLAPGTMIDFNLIVERDTSYIEGIRVRHYESVEQDPLTARRLSILTSLADSSNAQPPIKVGDRIPQFSLIDQNRRTVSPSQFNEKVIVITFTYTHCALPNFCFRTANNLRRLQTRFTNQLNRNLVLVSITFDPEHDTPDVMAEYGKTWHADPDGWRLLTGSQSEIASVCRSFGISYWPDEGLMNHSLHTFVVDRGGILVADLEGNQFTAEELGDLVQSVLSRTSTGDEHTVPPR